MSPTDVPAGPLRLEDLCLDAVRSRALARTAEPRRDGVVLVDGVDTRTLWVNAVPEPRTAQQRVRLDVHVATVGDLVAHGARVLAEEEEHWTVLGDPEGGELCAFLRPAGELPGYPVAEVVVDAVDPQRVADWWDVLADPRAPEFCVLDPEVQRAEPTG